jgi:hypothetical protein
MELAFFLIPEPNQLRVVSDNTTSRRDGVRVTKKRFTKEQIAYALP